MSASIMVIVSLLYIVLLFAATMHNHRNEQKDLFMSSVFALFIYVVCHLGNTLWLSTLSPEEVLGKHYLYFAAMQVMLAVGLFFINRNNMRVIMSITIWLLVIEVLLGYAVHLDRNVVALNGATVPNMSLSAAWFLWDLRDWISQFTTLTVLLALTLPKIYQVKTDQANVAYSVLEKVEAYLALFEPSKKINRANTFVRIAAQNLCFYDGVGSEENINAAQAGQMLLNEAIKDCCYEPHRTKPVGFFGRFVYWLRS